MKLRAVCLLVMVAGGLAVAAPPASDPAYEANVLDVKFKEGTRVRMRNGEPTDVGNQAAVNTDLQGILNAFSLGQWDRTHSVDEATLDRLRLDGQAHSAKPLPDLNNYFRLHLPPGLSAERAKAIIERYDSVQAAYFVPRPVAPPTPPDYSSSAQPTYQDYLDAAPSGIDARNAWTRGYTGAGIKVCDVEYWINFAHQDLPPITVLGPLPVDPFQDDHGTGVNGIIAAKNDGVGTKGIAYGASLYFAGTSTAVGYRVAPALMECGAALSAGDVVLIEQQFAGPNWAGGTSQFGFVPTEWSKPVYDAIVTLVANGIVVVETTGNGSQNLDDAVYHTGHDDHWPFLVENDSGALLVTGGQSPHSATPRGAHTWSNNGATVDLQGWGDSLVTTGYGTLYSAEGVNRFYRSDFGGSSGSGPMIAGAVAILQQAHKALYGSPATPAQIKNMLVATGTAQAGTLHLGPLPNLQAALDAVQQVVYVDQFAFGNNTGTSWANAFFELQEALNVATPGMKILVAQGVYKPDWDPIANVRTGSRTASFQLKNGVAILGGYGTAGGLRDPNAHPTYLSGEIATAAGTDNSYHVVTAGAAIDDSAVLDGFHVSAGRADGANPNDRGAGISIQGGFPSLRQLVVEQNYAARGGGIYNGTGEPSLERVTIDNNTASGASGGGMFNDGGGPRLTFVTFSNNVVSNPGSEGGGLFTQNGSPIIENSKFLGNSATRGGGLSSWAGGLTTLDNCEFRGNQASDLGGAVLNFQGTLRLNNATLSANTATTNGGGIYLFDPNTVTIRNSILWGNTNGQIIGASATVTRSIVQGGYAAGTNVDDLDPLFRTPGADLRLKKGSPALDKGDPTSVDGSTCSPTDIRGVERADNCDLGAYEYRGNPGSWWSNGEADLLHTGESNDGTPSAGAKRQSADDFVVPAGQACAISAFRGVLQDGTKVMDAFAELYSDASGFPSTSPLATWTIVSSCYHNGAACETYNQCTTGTSCSSDANCGNPLYQCVSGQCVSPCVMPGQSLGYRGAGKLWEPNFKDLDKHLGPGKYWLSIYGTQEAGSTGTAFAISAGEGAVQSTPYRFRQTGFGWVDGGPFNGNASHDLALDIDAVCGADADGDLSPVGLDCDDADANRFPGNPEICDGFDDNCDGLADSGATPTGVPTLTLPSRTQLSWTVVTGAAAFDVVHGSLSALRSSNGDFTTAVCDTNETTATTLPVTAAPPAGGLWYLVRPSSPCGTGTYNTTSPRQVQSRDAEIAASASACP